MAPEIWASSAIFDRPKGQKYQDPMISLWWSNGTRETSNPTACINPFLFLPPSPLSRLELTPRQIGCWQINATHEGASMTSLGPLQLSEKIFRLLLKISVHLDYLGRYHQNVGLLSPRRKSLDGMSWQRGRESPNLWEVGYSFYRAFISWCARCQRVHSIWTYTKIGTIQRRLAWPLRKDDTQIREAFQIFCRWMQLFVKTYLCSLFSRLKGE